MKKLLLTSTGFTNPKLGERFLHLLNKEPSQTMVLFIPTASRSENEMKYIKESENELVQLGIPRENIVWLDVNNVAAIGDINRFDAIYVCGGNTFFLMKKLKDTGLDKKIIELVNQGRVYVGVSAGSVIAGPVISIAGPFDENEVGLKDMTGLNLVNEVITPHYDKKEKSIIDEFIEKLPYKVIPITDNQALEETISGLVIVE
jgi:peptidase E